MKREKLLDQWYKFRKGEHSVGVRFLGATWHIYFRYKQKECCPDKYVRTYGAAKMLVEDYLKGK